jgi:hypothetical protein
MAFMTLFESLGSVHKIRKIRFINGRWGFTNKITDIKDGITIANLQNEFIYGLNLEDMIKKYCIL